MTSKTPRYGRRTKIIATLGPSSSDYATIKALFDSGVDVFRLNASHGTQADHANRYRILREIEAEVGHPIAILMDLQGPKLRVGSFKEGCALLPANGKFRLVLEKVEGDADRVTLPHPELFAAISAGTEILLDDGRIRLCVEQAGPDFADTRIVTGGTLSNHKGVNLPGAKLPMSALSAKDKADLDFALNLGVDWVALSFVQRPEDVLEARELVGDRAAILCKIEKPAALEELPRIVELSDAIMVARGDLGVELPPEDVPGIQKRIVRLCRSLGRPVVVATQMLESMVNSPTPTRAEASDVATAVFDSADAVMLSAESAAGAYPVEAVRMMDRIVRKAEAEPLERHKADEGFIPNEADAITAAAGTVATALEASAIATYTISGSTTLRAARERPSMPILGLTTRFETARRLTLAWGVHPFHTPGPDITDQVEMVERASQAAVEAGMSHLGDRLVITAGVPFGTLGTTNSLRVVSISETSSP